MGNKNKSGSKAEVQEILISAIRRFPGQPRKWFDPKTLAELGDSLKATGQQVSIIVTRVKNPGKDGILFELIDGERRWRAAKKIGWAKIRAEIRSVKDVRQQFLNSFVANHHRDGHGPIETAQGIKEMKDGGEHSVEEIAKMLGKSTPWAYQHLNLLKLHPGVLKLMDPSVPENQRLGSSMGILLLGITPPELQYQTAQKIVKTGMSFARSKDMINKIIFKKGLKKTDRQTPRKIFRVIQTFFLRTNEQLHIFTGKDSEELFRILDSRPFEEREALVADMQKAAQRIGQLVTIGKKTFGSKR